MKKIILVSFFAIGMLANAQVRIVNNVNNSALINSPAFIDASSNNAINTSTNVGKGLVFPRVDLSLMTSFPSVPMGTALGFPNRLDGMVVYNTKEGGAAGIGNTEGELTRGFWYYENPNGHAIGGSATGGTWKPLGSGSGNAIPNGVNSGDVLGWNGTAWMPAADNNTTYTAGTGLTLSGTTFSHTAHTGDVTGSTALTIANDAVTSAKILDGTIATADIANNAVTVAKLPAGATSTTFLRGDGTWQTVTGGTTYTATAPITLTGTAFGLADAGVTTAKLADNAVTTAKIANNAVTVAKLPAGATAATFLRGDGTWATPAATADWSLTGNSVSSSNFLGTTNAQPLVIKVNNVQSGYIAHQMGNGNYGTVSLGFGALPNNNAGCVAIGGQALASAPAVSSANFSSSTAVGHRALQNSTEGVNTAVGYDAIRASTTGNHNTAMGYRALDALTTGSHNLAIGSYAGSWSTNGTTTGSRNIMIGHMAVASSPTVNGEITIGSSGGTGTSTARVYAGSWSFMSDRNTKHNILPIGQGLSFVSRLKPVEYVYNNDDSGKKMLGFIAQEVQEAMTQENMNGYNLVNQMDANTLGLSTIELIPVLTKAIQEQQAIIETLKARIEVLETR